MSKAISYALAGIVLVGVLSVAYLASQIRGHSERVLDAVGSALMDIPQEELPTITSSWTDSYGVVHELPTQMEVDESFDDWVERHAMLLQRAREALSDG